MPRQVFCLRGCAHLAIIQRRLCTQLCVCLCLQAPAYGLKKEPGGFSQEESG